MTAEARHRAPDLSLAGALAVSLTLIPLFAAPALTGQGGGYTIDTWGFWAAATVAAAGIILLLARSRISGLQLLLPLSLFGLALWSLASIHWAAWPQSALVEADRYLFYASAATLVLVAPFTPFLRRLLVGFVGAAATLPALLVALLLWHSPHTSSMFDAGRLVANAGYPDGLAAAVAIGFWPMIAIAADRATPRLLRPPAAGAAGIVLATVVPTEARASLWALALSALVFFVLCPTPIRCGAIGAAALLPTVALWHDLNSVFSSAGAVGGHAVGRAILLVGTVAAVAGAVQVGIDQVVTLQGRARKAIAVAAAAWVVLVLVAGVIGVMLATNGHLLASAGRTLRHTVDSVGTGQPPPSEGEAGSRYGSLDTGRYELWQVALRGFRERPAEGWGAGNFGYLNVRIGQPSGFPYQAHSQLLEVASTLGIPGVGLYLVVICLPLGACVWVRLSDAPPSRKLTAAGAGGAVIYFTAHAQVDWIWQITACALPAILLAAVLVGMLPRGSAARRSTLGGVAGLLAFVTAAAVLIVPAALAQTYLQRSYAEPAPWALRDASLAARFDRLSGRPYLAEARALLRTGDTAGAAAAARRAAGAEPGFWVSWELLYVADEQLGNQVEAGIALDHVRELAPWLPLSIRGTVPGPGFDHG